MTTQRLAQLAVEVTRIVQRCRNQRADPYGHSMLDLVADNLPHESLDNLRAALVRAGLRKQEVA
ncbi:MAG TPA: hypothetical protein DCQ64_19940 [Candidatus Rokubacteria bacterium]|nr:hypothetical protein [Candidatus Rokubacteria bacterium]